MRGMGRPKAETVSAIQMLVANSVEGLSVDHVSVVDTPGNVLSTHEEARWWLLLQVVESSTGIGNYLSEKVESMLETVVGNGNVVARVSVKIATDSETITSEIYENQNPITNSARHP